MKKTLLLTLLYLLAVHSALRAQDYKVELDGKTNKILLEMRGSRVTVEGYSGNEIIIRGNGYQPVPKQAEGLRALSGAEDNTRIGLFVTQKDQAVRIVEVSRRATKYVIRVPRQFSVVCNQQQFASGDLEILNLQGDVEVNLRNGNVEVLNTAGGVVVSCLSGNVTVRYAAIGKAPSAVSTLAGNVDVAMPASSKATLQLRTTSGEVFTDLDIAVSNKGNELRQVGGQIEGGTVNGGGTIVSIQTMGGNIFLRKAK